MKKQLLLLAMMLLLPMVAMADSIHEEDLVGTTWILESSEGYFVRGQGALPNTIDFYTEQECDQYSQQVGSIRIGKAYYGITDYILYNSNGGLRLHITIPKSRFNLRFIVKHIDSDQIILQTYDKWCTLVYKRENSSSNINEIKPDKGNDQIYSIKGEMISNTSGKDVVIKNGKKYVVK